MTDVFDLVIKVKVELLKMKENHPADKNALIYGVLSGLTLGIARLRSGLVRDDRLLEVLANTKIKLPGLVHVANDFMPVGKFITMDMFICTNYRSSPSESYYSEGIKMGFNYAITAEEAYEEASSDKGLAINMAIKQCVDMIKAVSY